MKASNFVDIQSLKKWSVKEDIIFAFWNCQGLRTAYPTLCNILSEMQETPLVIGLCETFASYRDNFCAWDFQFLGFASERKERLDMERGGLAFLIKEGFLYWVRKDLSLWTGINKRCIPCSLVGFRKIPLSPIFKQKLFRSSCSSLTFCRSSSIKIAQSQYGISSFRFKF